MLNEILIGILFHVHIYLLSGFASKLKNLTARDISFLFCFFFSFPFYYCCVYMAFNFKKLLCSVKNVIFYSSFFPLFNMFSYLLRKKFFIFDINEICFYRWLCDFLSFIVLLGIFYALYLLFSVVSLVLLFFLSDYSFICKYCCFQHIEFVIFYLIGFVWG